MGVLDSTAEEPRSRLRRYIVSALIFLILLAVGLWYLFRFEPEKRMVKNFLDTVVAGNFEQAYRLWKPVETYTFQDFLEDWGPEGYYGPVRSYRITYASRIDGASGVIVTVEVSPDAPFPENRETEKLARIREVRLWVDRRNQSLGFAPNF
ncbi:MAG: hypothetical protein K6U02_06860 [Firmicutes bacterium]|nr:hypothetical protein [Bacillota bacterium]